jgi:magnesium-transporting ATPase (P-type)
MTDPRFTYRLAALLVLLAPAMPAQAGMANWDAVLALTVGTEVRVTAGARTVHGRLDRVTYDALALTLGTGPETFQMQQVTAVSSKKPSRRKRNALIGLGAGTATGLGIGIAGRVGPNQWQLIPNNVVTAVFTAAGALVGVVVGVVIPTGGWREVYRR